MGRSTSGKRAVGIAGAGTLLVLLLLWVYRAELGDWFQERFWRRIAVVVVDNCDPDYRSAPFADGVRFLSSSGAQLFLETGLNNAESIGSNHGVVLDPRRYRVFFRENVSGRVTAMDARGRVLYSVADVNADAMAIHPDTGHLWCLAGSRLGEGETVVLNRSGDRVAVYPIHGFDLAHNEHDDAFWAVGREITKFDSRGQVLVKRPPVEWAYVSVAPDHRDGSVWVLERRYSQGKGTDRVIRLDATGAPVKEVDLPSQTPFCVACDPETGTAWVVGYRQKVLRIPAVGGPLPPLEIPARSIAIGPRTGLIWVATDAEVLRVARDGTIEARHAFDGSSSQSWMAAR